MELTLDQALQKGVEAHKAGKAQEADRYYTAILKANPKHPDANHNFGLIALKMEEAAMAVQFFKNAIEANPTITEYWVSCINTLIELKDVKNAQIALDKAKEVGHVDDVFEKLASNLNLVIKEIDEVAAV